jgi:FKBP-type peptidyl-prolyl cis-trans isomerase
VNQVTFAPELGIVLDQMTRTPEGLFYHDLAEGTGDEADRNDRVKIHYNGFLPNGAPFDSSVARDEPIQFVLGMREVVRGWEIGVRGMKEGGRRLLVIPPDLGYGSRGLPGAVPGNATLVFEIQLLEVGE